MRAALDLKPTAIYRLRDVAQSLDVSLRTLERAVAAGRLTAVRVGRHTFVTGRNLLAWLEGAAGGKREPEETTQD